MMHDSPWDGLATPPVGALEARRADASHPHAFFYARNAHGHFMLTLQVAEGGAEVDSPPSLRGVEVLWLPALGRLQLRLHSAADRDMFAVLCRDLLASTANARSDEECIDLTLKRLSRWQRLLSRGQNKLLDEEQIRGLFAELLFLRDELIPRFGTVSISAWKGPQGYPQDFAINGLAIEVKSHLIGAPPVVRISSPEQLYAPGADLYLRVQRLAVASAGGMDLLRLVAEVKQMLVDQPEHLAPFELSLSEVGYHDAPEYGAYKLSAEGEETYLVGDDFPRLLPAAMPRGVCNITYSISLSALTGHRAAINWRT